MTKQLQKLTVFIKLFSLTQNFRVRKVDGNWYDIIMKSIEINQFVPVRIPKSDKNVFFRKLSLVSIWKSFLIKEHISGIPAKDNQSLFIILFVSF